MNQRFKYHLFTSNLFLLGLVLLLLNDFYLKYEFHNFLTGKLSDFAGLFIFPIFFSIYISKTKTVYFLTAVFFVYWKFEVSQPLIDTISNLTNISFQRVVDPSDLIALIVLPFSYYYFKKKSDLVRKSNISISFAIGLISFFSFCATSRLSETYVKNISSDKAYSLALSKPELLYRLNYRILAADSLKDNLKDSLYRVRLNLPNSVEVNAIVKLFETSDNNTIIKLDSILSYQVYSGGMFSGINKLVVDSLAKFSVIDFENHFENYYINIIKSKKFETKVYFEKEYQEIDGKILNISKY